MRVRGRLGWGGTVALVLAAGCGPTTAGTRSDSRAVVSGTVALEATPGLGDFSRVRVDLGRGEGGVTPGDDGSFEFSDVEPDVYTLTVTYVGGLTANAVGSAYKRLEARVVARAGGSVSVGTLRPQLGLGSVTGTITVEPPVNPSDSPAPRELEVTGPDGVVRTTVVSADGSFALTNVPVGVHQVKARVANQAAASTSPAACGQPVTVAVDGEAAPAQAMAFARTEPTFLGGASALAGAPNEWWSAGPTLTLRALTGVAVKSRTWVEGDEAPTWSDFPTDGWPLTLQPGRVTRYFQFQDVCGADAGTWAVQLVRDEDPPLVVEQYVRGVGSSIRGVSTDVDVVLVLDALDTLSNALTMQVATCVAPADGATASCEAAAAAAAPLPYTRTSLHTLPDADGEYLLSAVVKDRVGNAAATVSASVRLNRVAPAATVALVDGAGTTVSNGFTRSNVLRARVFPDAAVTALGVMPESGCDNAVLQPWVVPPSGPPSVDLPVTLAPPDGLKTVSVCVDNGAGQRRAVSATVTLDTTPPSRPRLAELPALTRVAQVTLRLAVPSVDTGSGLQGYLLEDDSGATGPWTESDPPRPVTDGLHTFRMRAVDNAGNTSTEDRVSVTVDSTAPLAPVVSRASSLGRDALVEWHQPSPDVVRVRVHYDGALALNVPPDSAALNGAMRGTGLSNGASPFVVTGEKQVRLRNIPKGALFVSLVAEDAAGNISVPSAPVRVDGGLPTLEVLSVSQSPRAGSFRNMPGTPFMLAATAAAVQVVDLQDSVGVVATIPTFPALGRLETATAGTYLEAGGRSYAAFAVPQRAGLRRWGDIFVVELGPVPDPAGPLQWSSLKVVRSEPALGEVTDMQALPDGESYVLAWSERRAEPAEGILSWLTPTSDVRRVALVGDERPFANAATPLFQPTIVGQSLASLADVALALTDPGHATLYVPGCRPADVDRSCGVPTCSNPKLLARRVNLRVPPLPPFEDRIVTAAAMPADVCGVSLGSMQQPRPGTPAHVLTAVWHGRLTSACSEAGSRCTITENQDQGGLTVAERTDAPLRRGSTVLDLTPAGAVVDSAAFPDAVVTAVHGSDGNIRGALYSPVTRAIRGFSKAPGQAAMLEFVPPERTLQAPVQDGRVAALDLKLMEGPGSVGRSFVSLQRWGGSAAVARSSGAQLLGDVVTVLEDHAPMAMAELAGFVFTAEGSAGVGVLDFANARVPFPRETVQPDPVPPFLDRARDVARFQDHIITVGPDGAAEYDVSIPWKPVLLGTFTTVRGDHITVLHRPSPMVLVTRETGDVIVQSTFGFRLNPNGTTYLSESAPIYVTAAGSQMVIQGEDLLSVNGARRLVKHRLSDLAAASAGGTVPFTEDTPEVLAVERAGGAVLALGNDANFPELLDSNSPFGFLVGTPLGPIVNGVWGAQQQRRLVFTAGVGGVWLSPAQLDGRPGTALTDLRADSQVVAASPVPVAQVLERNGLVLGLSPQFGVIAWATPADGGLSERASLSRFDAAELRTDKVSLASDGHEVIVTGAGSGIGGRALVVDASKPDLPVRASWSVEDWPGSGSAPACAPDSPELLAGALLPEHVALLVQSTRSPSVHTCAGSDPCACSDSILGVVVGVRSGFHPTFASYWGLNVVRCASPATCRPAYGQPTMTLLSVAALGLPAGARFLSNVQMRAVADVVVITGGYSDGAFPPVTGGLFETAFSVPGLLQNPPVRLRSRVEPCAGCAALSVPFTAGQSIWVQGDPVPGTFQADVSLTFAPPRPQLAGGAASLPFNLRAANGQPLGSAWNAGGLRGTSLVLSNGYDLAELSIGALTVDVTPEVFTNRLRVIPQMRQVALGADGPLVTTYPDNALGNPATLQVLSSTQPLSYTGSGVPRGLATAGLDVLWWDDDGLKRMSALAP